MNPEHLAAFARIQPPDGIPAFRGELQTPERLVFSENTACDPGEMADALKNGVQLLNELPDAELPETALQSLKRLLNAKGVREEPGGYPVRFRQNAEYAQEEYRLEVTPSGAELCACDREGFRRGIYFLEDRIREVRGASVTAGVWHRKPAVRYRISRCFFGPTNRPPFCVDELLDEVDYYPEAYLDKLAHESINGLWISMLFRDMPSTLFPEHGKDFPKRIAKLRKVIARCAAYGIKIYIFFSEPKAICEDLSGITRQEVERYPELMGSHGSFSLFCTSSAVGKKYLAEDMEALFAAVPGLGGVINIMFGEDNTSCAAYMLGEYPLGGGTMCPVCAKRDYAEILREEAEIYLSVIQKYNPDAVYIGWFYAPMQRDNTDFMKRLLHVSEKWPSDAVLMFNAESGAEVMQLGKKRTVFDYSLAFPGHSELFAGMAQKVKQPGAKIQVGCSHEDASVPYLPVPGNLYEKYRFLQQSHVSAVMQCWYFGNYPGVMNRAAGELSFAPLPDTMETFLTALARPCWGKYASKIAQAWTFFSEAYQNFPANLYFEWYGLLHQSIVFPLYFVPADLPLPPSWLLKQFPAIAGDRIGECLGFHHTLAEAVTLCAKMSTIWTKGERIMADVMAHFAGNQACESEWSVAQAVGLQMKSALNVLRFYALREDMFGNKVNHLAEMAKIVRQEIQNTQAMCVLCEKDSRLGYHSEAEGYLFFPEKLHARKLLLEELLDVDFAQFDLSATWIDEYTGRNPQGKIAEIRRAGKPFNIYKMSDEVSWHAAYDDDFIYVTLTGVAGKEFHILLEPCRLWPPLHLYHSLDGEFSLTEEMFPEQFFIESGEIGSEFRCKIPLRCFDGFRRANLPMRINIYGADFHWLSPHPWPFRLLLEEHNPANMGYLIFA